MTEVTVSKNKLKKNLAVLLSVSVINSLSNHYNQSRLVDKSLC